MNNVALPKWSSFGRGNNVAPRGTIVAPDYHLNLTLFYTMKSLQSNSSKNFFLVLEVYLGCHFMNS